MSEKLRHNKNFTSLFGIQFLGAGNDNFFKIALVLLITFNTSVSEPLAEQLGVPTTYLIQQLNALAGALFILPFFLFSALAGQIADKYGKPRLIVYIKAAELCIMTLAAYGFITSNPIILLVCLFLMGIQSTFFGPIKYSFLPDILPTPRLVQGNAVIQAGTYGAILLGSIAGGVLIAQVSGPMYVSAGIILFAAMGLWLARRIALQAASAPNTKINYNPFTSTYVLLKYAYQKKTLGLSMLALSWFWLVGIAMITLVPLIARHILGGDEYVSVSLLAIATLGAVCGSLLCHVLLKNKPSPVLAPYGAAIMAISLFLLSILPVQPMGSYPIDIYLNSFLGAASLGLTFVFALGGGMFAVPLFVMLQAYSPQGKRSQVIAGANILNSLFMAVGSLGLGFLLGINHGESDVLSYLAYGNAIMAVLALFAYMAFKKIKPTPSV